MPKLSVIVPVYRVEKYIERCARSLFAQSLDDIEFLFVDDCTPDKSVEILLRVLDEFPERRKQVKIHRMEKNSGQALVRRWGMQHATGEFVIHCDSDDWVKPDAYRIMYDMAVKDRADIVVCDIAITDGTTFSGVLKGCEKTEKEKFLKDLLLQKNPWSLCNKMFRRVACYGENLIYPKGNFGEDMVICFQLLLNGGKTSYIPLALYNYYSNPLSITNNREESTIMNNFYQDKENVSLLSEILSNAGITKALTSGLNFIKWRVKCQLWNTKFDGNKVSLWRATYPEIHKWVYISRYVPLKEKIKCFITHIGIYSLIKNRVIYRK